MINDFMHYIIHVAEMNSGHSQCDMLNTNLVLCFELCSVKEM